MEAFKKKHISKGQTLGNTLHKTRLEQNISLEEVQSATNIQAKYLVFLEEGNYQKLPGNIYTKSWIKIYGKFLGLDISDLLSEFKIEKSISDKLTKVESLSLSNKDFSKKTKFLGPRLLKISIIGLVVIILLGYLAWEVNNIVSAPEVNIIQPVNNFKTTESHILIIGETEPEVQLTINNDRIVLDADGNWQQNVNLVAGLNNLEISAKKKHSKTRIIELIIYREGVEF